MVILVYNHHQIAHGILGIASQVFLFVKSHVPRLQDVPPLIFPLGIEGDDVLHVDWKHCSEYMESPEVYIWHRAA